MHAILFHALAVHAVAAAGHLSAARSWHVLGGSTSCPHAKFPGPSARQCDGSASAKPLKGLVVAA